MGEVILVCGPPAAGKTTWVRQNMARGDRVVDYDALCRELGSRSRYDHPPRIRRLASSMRRSLEDRAAQGPGRTWVIRSLPKAEDRAAAAQRLGARVVVLATPADEAIARSGRDGRPAWTEDVIRDWWRDYTPSDTDEVGSDSESRDVGHGSA